MKQRSPVFSIRKFILVLHDEASTGRGSSFYRATISPIDIIVNRFRYTHVQVYQFKQCQAIQFVHLVLGGSTQILSFLVAQQSVAPQIRKGYLGQVGVDITA